MDQFKCSVQFNKSGDFFIEDITHLTVVKRYILRNTFIKHNIEWIG